ncbi:phage major capsid protein [Cupriavidus taiwanensis]|uniref:phage major capsid protein n=1 Tax=Cupriavidus taiwanensis TaxID=164546 RepID=UPI001EFFC1B6|nr:phage major capsid protein [Cupriavidus taiwanensis]
MMVGSRGGNFPVSAETHFLRDTLLNVRIPRQAAGTRVGWVGENKPKPVSKLGFDAITMPASKIAGIIAITEELARFSSPSAEELVRRDLVATIPPNGRGTYRSAIRPDAAANSRGSITYGAQTSAAARTTWRRSPPIWPRC